MKTYQVTLAVAGEDVEMMIEACSPDGAEAVAAEIFQTKKYGILKDVLYKITGNGYQFDAGEYNVYAKILGKAVLDVYVDDETQAAAAAVEKLKTADIGDLDEVEVLEVISVKQKRCVKTITAVERDGFDLNLMTVCFEVPEDSEFDLLQAIRSAAHEYLKTDAGKRALKYNCGCYNLADVVNSLPRDLCEKYGFKLLDMAQTDEIVDWDFDFADDLPEEEEEE